MGIEERSDDEHLRSLAVGDVAAFDALFERHGDFVHNLVFRRTATTLDVYGAPA